MSPPVLWRDPQTLPRDVLRERIADLERAVTSNPESADLWTCLGMGYAMDFQVHRSVNALETAVRLAPEHFWARFKFAELHYRLRALDVAEEATIRALDLASNHLENAISRRQL